MKVMVIQLYKEGPKIITIKPTASEIAVAEKYGSVEEVEIKLDPNGTLIYNGYMGVKGDDFKLILKSHFEEYLSAGYSIVKGPFLFSEVDKGE